ncbi:MAG: T9SS type A sorting domain-containing protein, partial [Chitinophagales bacterium]
TGSDIDLGADGYVINRYANGVTTATPFALTGTIISGGTHVVCNGGSNTDIFNKADEFSNIMSHNGDDAMELVRGSITLDVIGQIGFDPGTRWENNGVSTRDQTLRRKASILEGDKSGGDAFDPSIEWDAYPQNNNDFLGVHVSDCISCNIAVNIEGNGDFCAGESAMLDAGVYEPLLNVYEWSNGEMTQMIETTTPGTYTVTVTNDAGCQGTNEIKVNALASFEVSADSESISQTGTGLQVYQIEICGGKLPYSLDLDKTGGFATAFQLFAGSNCRTIVVQYDQVVDWVLTVNDGNECGLIVIDSEDLATTEYGALSIVTTEVIKETCPNTLDGGLTIEIQGGDNSCGSYDIEWSGPNYTSTSTVNVTTLPASTSLSSLASGNYSVTITDCDGQTLSTNIGVGRKNRGRGRGRNSVNCNPSVDKAAITHSSIDFVGLYPNPFSQTAQLQFGLSITAYVAVDIYTMDGRKAANIFNGNVEEGQNNTFVIDGSDLAAGMYVLRLTTDSGVVHHEKLYISK